MKAKDREREREKERGGISKREDIRRWSDISGDRERERL